MNVTLADGTQVVSKHALSLSLVIPGVPHMPISARLVDNLLHDFVLGMDWLRQYNPTIDWVAYTVAFGPRLPVVHCLPTRTSGTCQCLLCSITGTCRGPRCSGLVFIPLPCRYESNRRPIGGPKMDTGLPGLPCAVLGPGDTSRSKD